MGRYLEIASRVIAEQDSRRAVGSPYVSIPNEMAPTTNVRTNDETIAPNDATNPKLPRGVRLICFEPKIPPVAIDVCSVVVDVEKFIRTELAELNARLHSPVQIRGGWGVFAILDRLRQVGVELTLEPSLENPQPGPTAPLNSSEHDFGTPRSSGGEE